MERCNHCGATLHTIDPINTCMECTDKGVIEMSMSENFPTITDNQWQLFYDSVETPVGLHDTRVDIIVQNAFNGFGDSTGSDDFGFSVAWLDLCDHLELGGFDVPDFLHIPNDPYNGFGELTSAWLSTTPGASRSRWILAFIQSDGQRYVVGYSTLEDMLHAYRSYEAEYIAWEDYNEEEEEEEEEEVIVTWEAAYAWLVENGVSEDIISIVTAINGTSIDTMESILYAKFGYRSFDQVI